MKVCYINPFLRATREVMEAMVHVPFVQGRPSLKYSGDRLHKLYDLSVVIQLSGAVKGLAVVSLSQPVACALAGGLAGVAFTELVPECCDAIAELANMIVGAAKRDFPGGQVVMSVPAVTKTAEVEYNDLEFSILIPCDTPHGRFAIEVAVHEDAHPASAT